MWQGKQKAALAALGAFAASLILKFSTGGDVSDMVNDPATAELATIAADLAQSAIIAAVTYAAAYFKTNVAADGTEMQFVKPAPVAGAPAVVVDAQGETKGKLV